MATDTSVQELIINKLTKAQYDAALKAGTINENELYMVTDTTYPTTEDLVANYQPLINESNKLAASLVSGLANIATTGEYSDLVNAPVLANIATSGEYSDLVNAPVLANVATSGDYNDLTNKPSVVQSDWAETNSSAPAFILNKPTLANIATTGEWADLVNVPAFKNIATTAEWSDLVNVPAFKNIATTAEYSDLVNAPVLATVATSGEYSDLVNAPVLATVATSGDYNDLTNKPTVDQTYNASSANAQSGTAVASAISSAISSVYKPAGSSTFVGLPTPAAGNLGNVYNMSEEFTTDDRFVEGAGSKYPAGTNVVIVNVGTDVLPEYKFDVLAGFIDLSGYAKSADLATVATSGDYNDLTNKPTVDQTYNASSTNAQSGTAVANAIADMQTITNMVDVVSNTSTNTSYPTASAVYNAVNTKSTVVFRDWSSN